MTPAAPGTASLRESGRHIRLLYVVADGFPTFRVDVAVLFGKYLPRFGIKSDLITHATRKSWRDATTSWTAGTVFAADWHPGHLRRAFSVLGYIPWTILFSRAGEYSAIQARDSVLAGLIGLLKSRASGLPFYYWMSFPRDELLARLARTNGFSLGIVRWLEFVVRGNVGAWLLYRIVLPASDHVFVQSDRMLADLSARGISAQKMTPVPMGVDLELFENYRMPELPNPVLKGRRLIAYLGTCGAVRRVDFLVDVVDGLRQRFPDILLLLIGDADEPAEKKALRRLISAKRLDDFVHVTGWLDQTQALAYLAHAEVALAVMPPDPLLDSASPTKLVEYLALGKPVVANEHPDQSAVLRASGAGFHIPLRCEAFVNAISTLLTDRALAAEFSEAGRRYVKDERNYRQLAQMLAAVYKKLLGQQVGDVPFGGGRPRENTA